MALVTETDKEAWHLILELENSGIRIIEALKPSNILIMQGVLFWIPSFLGLKCRWL